MGTGVRLRRSGFVALAALLVLPVLVFSPAAAATPVGATAPRMIDGDPLPYLHHNYFQRVSVVMVNDMSRPLFQVQYTPIYVDRYDYGVVRYDPVYETRVVNNYAWRTYTVRTGWTSVPVYATRSTYQVVGWRSVPEWGSRSVCLDRWRSLCLRWGTEYYIVRYTYEPTWGWRSETYVSGYTYEPVYETRTEMYVRDTVTIREQVGTFPVMGLVKVCSQCMLERFQETKVLLGYEQYQVEQLTGPSVDLLNCRAAGPNGDCGAKSRRFHAGAWWDYVGHSDSYAPRWEANAGRVPTGFPDCLPGQIRTLDGLTCITPTSPPTTTPTTPPTTTPTTTPRTTAPSTTPPPTTAPSTTAPPAAAPSTTTTTTTPPATPRRPVNPS